MALMYLTAAATSLCKFRCWERCLQGVGCYLRVFGDNFRSKQHCCDAMYAHFVICLYVHMCVHVSSYNNTRWSLKVDRLLETCRLSYAHMCRNKSYDVDYKVSASTSIIHRQPTVEIEWCVTCANLPSVKIRLIIAICRKSDEHTYVHSIFNSATPIYRLLTMDIVSCHFRDL
jgi:hypothetical protein